MSSKVEKKGSLTPSKPPSVGKRGSVGSGAGLQGALTILVLSAQGIAVDAHCDSYCQLTLANPSKSKRLRTAVKKRSNSPEWNELLVFEVDGADELHVAVKDWKRLKHDKLGSGVLQLSGLIDGTELNIVLPLSPRGQVQLCLRFDDYQCLFGLPLADVVSRENELVPHIVMLCCAEIERRGLGDVGLYRVSGNQVTVRHLRDAFIKNPRLVKLDVDTAGNVSNVAAVLKLYLRELPEPLFTSANYAAFIKAGKRVGSLEAQRTVVQNALRNVPKPNLDTIVFLFDHFHRVLQNGAVNLMTPAGLATCLGPTLLTPAETDTEAMAHYDVMAQNTVIMFILEQWPALGLSTQGAVAYSAPLALPVQPLVPPLPAKSLSAEPMPTAPCIVAEDLAIYDLASPSANHASEYAAVLVTVADDPHGGTSAADTDTLAEDLPLPVVRRPSRLMQPGGDGESGVSRMSIKSFSKSRLSTLSAIAKTAELTPDEFTNACVYLGLDKPPPTVRALVDDDAGDVPVRDAKSDSQETARARVASVSTLMKRWEKKTASAATAARPAVSSKAQDLARSLFEEFAVVRMLDVTAFRVLCYDLGHVVRDARVYETLAGKGAVAVSLLKVLAWWKTQIFPLVAKAYETPERMRSLRQAIHSFQFLDPAKEGRLAEEQFVLLHTDLMDYGFPNIPGNAGTALKQLQSSAPKAKSKEPLLELNDFISWLIKIDALKMPDDDQGAALMDD